MGDDDVDTAPGAATPEGESAAPDGAADGAAVPDAEEIDSDDSIDSDDIEVALDESALNPEPEAEPEPEPEPEEEPEDLPLSFRRRVETRARTMRYANNLHRPTFTPDEKERLQSVNRSASFWVPILTVGLVAFCAIVSVALAVHIVANEEASVTTRTISVGGIALVLIGCFTLLLRSQDHFDHMRPRGRFVRNDIADAYEAIRDAPYLLVDLQASDELLQRVADLLPVAERLVDYLVEHEATSHTPVRLSPAYDELIKIGAEVNVVVEMRQEALGLKPRPPSGGEWWTERVAGVGELPGYASLVDLASSLGRVDPPKKDEEPDEPKADEAERTIAQVKTLGGDHDAGLPPLRPQR